MELTDHQTHLKSVTEQAQGLVNEINQLEGQAKSKREMLLKLQGIIEYRIMKFNQRIPHHRRS